MRRRDWHRGAEPAKKGCGLELGALPGPELLPDPVSHCCLLLPAAAAAAWA
jgi:hypothetical protein